MGVRMNPPQAAQQKAPAPSFEAWRAKTQRLRVQLSQVSLTNPGDTKTFQTDRVGYVEGIDLDVTATITSDGAAAGTWDSNFFPFNLLSKILIQNNSGYVYCNMSGFEALIAEKVYMGTGSYPDVAISPLSGFSGTQGARNAQCRVLNSTDGTVVTAGTALAASKTYKLAFRVFVPLAAHRDLKAGLVMVQNTTAALSVSVTVDQLTTIASVTAGTLSLTACSITPTQVMYTIPNDPLAQPYAPGQGIRNRWISEGQNWTASGQQDYRVPIGGMIVRMFPRFLNVSSSRFVPGALYATANDPTSANFTTIQTVYGSVQMPDQFTLGYALRDARMKFGSDFPDGVIPIDLGVGDSLDNGIDTMALVNTRQLTEYKLSITSTITPAAGSTLQVLRQELQLPAAA